MKADEVLRRYAAGERDFRRISLRGQSFKRKDLSGADFSEADIRGAIFTNAYLKDAKFCGAKAGLQLYWTICLVIVSWILSGLSGILAGSTAYLASVVFDSNIANFFTGVVTIILIAIFFIIAIRKGLVAGLGSVAIAVALIVAGTLTVVMAGALAVAVTFTATVVVAGALAIAVTFAAIVARFIAVVGALVIAVISAATVTQFITIIIEQAVPLPEPVTVAVAGTCTIAVMLFSAYLGWRAWAGDEQHAWIQRVAVACAATGGTSFRCADLTDADFTSATLKSTDFRQANLTRTCWRNTEKLELVRPGTTYLHHAKVRQLLITRQGQDKNFDRQNLRGVNLQGANLADISFIRADLSEANLQDADLSRAKLVQTQLDEADLTGATLTGATIEDWNITSHTKLQGIRCRYVFMRLPTKDDPNQRRKPDNWDEEFEDGDFADFIKPIVDTLDLYHNQGVDPRAIAISFKQLAENNPDAELEIVAMEKRGKDKFLLRAATAPEADHSDLYAEYSKIHNHIKALAESEVQALLTEKDSQIPFLRTTIETLLKVQLETVQQLQRPSFYVQKYNNQGDTMSNAPRKYTKNDFSGSTFMGGFVNADTSYAHQIGRDINNYPPEQRQNLADAAAEIQQLLQQLESTYPNATEIEKQSALAVTLQQEIKQNPTFRTRLRNALKEGGIEALKVLFAPIGIPIEMVRGWIEAEAE